MIHDEGKEDVESLAKAAHGLPGGQDIDIVSERSHAANGMPNCDDDALRAPVPTFADKAAAPPQAALDNDNSGFVEVGKRRKPCKKGDNDVSRHGALPSGRSATSARRAAPVGLKGAQRARCMPFHLSGMCLESCEDDVFDFCSRKGVLITGCYLLRSRVWGTKSAKIYVDINAKETVLSDSFWPDILKCRVWEASAPSSGKANSPSQY